MLYQNKVQIIGNLTRDPERKTLESGTTVANFSVATNHVWMKEGEKQESVEFHNIVAFGKQADTIAQYMTKGSQILVEGRLQTRNWEGEDGKKNYRTEIILGAFQFGNKAKQEEDKPVAEEIEDSPY
tara:strand:- start:156 stop:536 length:381 start_codon:yes stop_codon:yes gene_type:complete